MILWLDPGDTATPEHTSAVPALLSREKSGWSPELSAAAQRPPRAVQPPGPGASSEASGQDRGQRQGEGRPQNRTGLSTEPKLGQAKNWYTETRKILPSLTCHPSAMTLAPSSNLAVSTKAKESPLPFCSRTGTLQFLLPPSYVSSHSAL